MQQGIKVGGSEGAASGIDSSEFAPTYTVPASPVLLTGIEYPGPVRSVPRALKTLGGAQHVSKVLSGTHPKLALELNLNPRNRFAHPVPAHIGGSANVVLEVVRRKRKNPKLDSDFRPIEEGVFSVKVAGIVTQTVRFRAMADFQYLHTKPDPMVNLTTGMRSLNADAINAFEFPTPHEDFDTDQYLPPPVFSRHEIPTVYDFKNVGQATEKTTVVDGVEQTRLVNVSRFQVKRIRAISSVDSEVPLTVEDGDVDNNEEINGDQAVNAMLDKLLQERPIWTRTAMLNRVAQEGIGGNNQALKRTMPLKLYTFTDGAFKDLLIRFGYDPRTDPKARFYQHIVLRNLRNTRTKRSGVATGIRTSTGVLPKAPGSGEEVTGEEGFDANAKGKGKSKATSPPPDASRSNSTTQQQFQDHIFDGQTLYAPVANYQLIDIIDPLIRSVIENSAGVLPAFSPPVSITASNRSGSHKSTINKDRSSETGDLVAPGEGWWDSDYFEQIRQLLRRKFYALRDGRKVTDLECSDLLGDPKVLFGGASSRRNMEQSEGTRDRSGSISNNGESDLDEDENEDNAADKEGDDVGDKIDSQAGSSRGLREQSRNSQGKSQKTGASVMIRKKKTSLRAPWESRKKKTVLAKRRDTNETEEQRAERLRRTIGLKGASQREEAYSEEESEGNLEE